MAARHSRPAERSTNASRSASTSPGVNSARPLLVDDGDAFFVPSILLSAHSHQPRHSGKGETARAAPGGRPMLCRKRVVRASSSCLCVVLQFSSSAMMSTMHGSCAVRSRGRRQRVLGTNRVAHFRLDDCPSQNSVRCRITRREPRTGILRGQADTIDWPCLTGMCKGEDCPRTITVVIRQMLGNLSVKTILQLFVRLSKKVNLLHTYLLDQGDKASLPTRRTCAVTHPFGSCSAMQMI